MRNKAFGRFWVVVALLATGPANSAQDPQEVVRRGADSMLHALRENHAELERDKGLIYGLVKGILAPHFDFALIAKYALGKSWARASSAQRKAFEAEFRELLVRTYALALLKYSDQEVSYAPAKLSEGGSRAKVATKIHSSTASPLSVDYRLRLDTDGWKVYDVAIDGVSLIATYRKSFASQITRIGLDGLINSLAQRNAAK